MRKYNVRIQQVKTYCKHYNASGEIIKRFFINKQANSGNSVN
jgi:hypothetical protein